MRSPEDLLAALRGPRASRRDLLASVVAIPILGQWFDGVDREQRWGSRRLSLTGDGQSDQFGRALALQGQTALVGAAGATTEEDPPTGAAFLFTRTQGRWTRSGVLSPSAPGNRFGASVALDDRTALIGDPLGDAGDSVLAGTVTAFERSDDRWRRTATLTPSQPTGLDRFGSVIDLDGDTAVIGARTTADEEQPGAGVAYVFRRNAGGKWYREDRLRPTAGDRRFGRAVALEGEIAAISGLERTGGEPGAGTVALFTRSESGWRRETRLPADRDYGRGGFGDALALDGETVLVGAPGETTEDGYRAGAAYVFARSGDRWLRTARLRPPVGQSDDRFGRAVALHGDNAVIVAAGAQNRTTGGPATGAAHLFSRVRGRWRWRGVETLANRGTPQRATTAALDANRGLIGASQIGGEPNGHGGTVRVIER